MNPLLKQIEDLKDGLLQARKEIEKKDAVIQTQVLRILALENDNNILLSAKMPLSAPPTEEELHPAGESLPDWKPIVRGGSLPDVSFSPAGPDVSQMTGTLCMARAGAGVVMGAPAAPCPDGIPPEYDEQVRKLAAQPPTIGLSMGKVV
jgi:hypothetical protein